MRREPNDAAAAEALEADEQAVEWHVRASSGVMSGDDRRALERWLSADPAHARAYRDLERVWRDSGDLLEEPGSIRPRAAAIRPRRRLPLALAAAVTLLLAVSAAVLWRSGYGAVLLNDHATGVGGRLALRLPDGSALWLGPRSAVDVEFDGTRRRLVLQHGRLFVRVAPDPARPFTVAAGGATVAALGTAFAVERSRADEVSVAVAEQDVAVHWFGRELARLPAGRQMRVDAHGAVGPPTWVDRRAVAAWRQGRLIAEGQTVGSVAENLSDYRMAPIVVADAATAALRVSAVLDLNDTDAALASLEAVLPVRIQPIGPLLTLVLSADSPRLARRPR